MKQTAVEWLEEKFKENLKHIVINNDHVLMESFFLQAKEMEKEQIMLANGAGYKDGILYANGEQWLYESPEQYYNETYKQD